MNQITTPTGVNEDVETAEQVKQTEPTERELAMERIAADNAARAAAASGEQPAEVQPVAAAPEKAEEIDVSTQVGKQLEDGSILLDESVLSKAFVKQKIDGREEMVPADKVFRQYQKGAAADLRLAEATRMQKEAADLLAQAQTNMANATSSAERRDAAAEVEVAAGLVEKQKELFSALFSGDEEKAGKLLGDFVKTSVDAALASRPAPAVSDDELANRIAPKLKQRLSVDSALEQLFKDYPEIHDDADMAVIADRYVNRFEAEGKSRAEAIAEAGDAMGAKFKLGKFAEAGRPEASGSPTTRDEKLEKKRTQDEPRATSARALSTEPPPQTPSQTIAEMARARATSSA